LQRISVTIDLPPPDHFDTGTPCFVPDLHEQVGPIDQRMRPHGSAVVATS
jgi:hypothetical protein